MTKTINAPACEAVSATGRRGFLKGLVAAGALAIAPGVTLYKFAEAAETTGVSNQVRWGMLIDINKCRDDCDACVTACSKENGWANENPNSGSPRTDAQWIRKVSLKHPGTGHKKSLPMMCQHCAEPPCVYVCPTGASFKRDDGIVLVDKHICIGCRYCMMACPYKARSFVHEDVEGQKSHAPRGKGTVESCTLCVHRIDKGQQPACVEACASDGGGAFLFGDLNDPASDIAKQLAQYGGTAVRGDLGVEPGVLYRGL
jgi:tetrathionate reductase subunit B